MEQTTDDIRNLKQDMISFKEIVAGHEDRLMETKRPEIVCKEHIIQQEKMASIGQLAAGVAHEINNPMSFISCNLFCLGEYFEDLLTLIAVYRDILSALKDIIRTFVDKGHVCIRIIDAGFGIPEENLAKIFDPFFTTKGVWSGSGIGLYVAYNIVMRHKGTIGVESKVDKGTVVTVRIPAE